MRQQADTEKDELYKQIGQLKVELDFLKKELASSTDDKRPWIDPTYRRLSIQQQCELLGLPRSTYYYQPRRPRAENLQLLRTLDECIRRVLLLWRRKMAVQRAASILGIEAHYPKPNGPARRSVYLPAARRGDREAQPRLEHRYYLPSDARRLSIWWR